LNGILCVIIPYEFMIWIFCVIIPSNKMHKYGWHILK